MPDAVGFWADEKWLPRNISWHQMPVNPSDLWYPVYFAVPFVLFRILWESVVGVTGGWLLGYLKGPLLTEIWDHLAFGFTRNTRKKRVLECFWRFSFYFAAFSYGLAVLWSKAWLYDVRHVWIGYPFHKVDTTIWWYYMMETGFYYSLLLAATFDVRRQDFWQLIIHHFITIGLLSVSWTINFVRIGTLILISHDISDVFLEGGKLIRYDRSMKVTVNVMYVFFFGSWILARLIYYPFVVIRSCFIDAARLIQPDYNLYDPFQIPYVPRLIILLLFGLLLLHVFWTFIILKILVKTVTEGVAGDVRSDSENESDEEDTGTKTNGEARKKVQRHRKKKSQ